MIKIVALPIILAVFLAAVVFLTVTSTIERDLFLPAHFSINIGMAVFAFAASWFFLTSLDTFRPQFRMAYYFLCTGIVLAALAQLQFPLLILTHTTESWWVTTGVVIIPFALTTIFLYLGTYKMARILSIQSWAARPLVVVALALLVVAVSFILPHPRELAASPGAELSFDIFAGLLAFNTVVGVASFILVKKVRAQLGNTYDTAMKWLVLFYIGVIVSGAAEWLHTFMFPAITWYSTYGLHLLPLLITTFVMMIAGIHFRAIARTRFTSDATFIDIVTTAAELSSDPKRTDSYLKTIKAITTVLSAKEEPSPTQKRLLVSIYQEIEQYLTSNRDPVRRFTQDQLRSQLPESFINLLRENRNVSLR